MYLFNMDRFHILECCLVKTEDFFPFFLRAVLFKNKTNEKKTTDTPQTSNAELL